MKEVTFEQIETMLKQNVKEIVDNGMKEAISPVLAQSEDAQKRLEAVERSVLALRASRQIFGTDVTGLSNEQKEAFAQKFIDAMNGKAFSAEDAAGGAILIPSETYAGIFRIAQTVGLCAKFATRFPMNGVSEMIVPRYTGSSLQGAYVGEGTETSSSAVSFGDATLRTRTWQVVLRIPNKLLQNALVDVADWLMGLIAEGLAYQMDNQMFNGVGTPFVGILVDANVNVVTLASGATTYAAFGYEKASEGIAAVEESVLDGSAFYMHRTVLHALRIQKDSANNYLLTNPNPVIVSEVGSGLRAQGYILNYPIFTSPVLPSTATVSQTGTKFAAFGNLKNVFLGDGGNMEVAKSDSATIDGVNVFNARQTAFRVNHDHSIVIGLPDALVAFKTAAS